MLGISQKILGTPREVLGASPEVLETSHVETSLDLLGIPQEVWEISQEVCLKVLGLQRTCKPTRKNVVGLLKDVHFMERKP